MRTVSGAQHWRRKTGKLSSEPCLFDLRSAVSTNLDFRKQSYPVMFLLKLRISFITWKQNYICASDYKLLQSFN